MWQIQIQKTFIDPQKGSSFAALPATTGAPQHKISHVKNPNRYLTTMKGRWTQDKVKWNGVKWDKVAINGQSFNILKPILLKMPNKNGYCLIAERITDFEVSSPQRCMVMAAWRHHPGLTTRWGWLIMLFAFFTTWFSQRKHKFLCITPIILEQTLTVLNRARVDIITRFYKNKLEQRNMRLGLLVSGWAVIYMELLILYFGCSINKKLKNNNTIAWMQVSVRKLQHLPADASRKLLTFATWHVTCFH